jgi:hypothetical protein
MEAPWQHDMYGAAAAAPVAAAGAGAVALFTGGKLLVSNLDFGVTDEDLSELFQEFGAVKSATVHYDSAGMGSSKIFLPLLTCCSRECLAFLPFGRSIAWHGRGCLQEQELGHFGPGQVQRRDPRWCVACFLALLL